MKCWKRRNHPLPRFRVINHSRLYLGHICASRHRRSSSVMSTICTNKFACFGNFCSLSRNENNSHLYCRHHTCDTQLNHSDTVIRRNSSTSAPFVLFSYFSGIVRYYLYCTTYILYMSRKTFPVSVPPPDLSQLVYWQRFPTKDLLYKCEKLFHWSGWVLCFPALCV
jgi:hypothetical protein